MTNPTHTSAPITGPPFVPRAASTMPEPGATELTLLDLLHVVLAHRRLMVAVSVGVAAILVALALLQPRTFTATAAFVPQGAPGARPGIAGLAAQLGFSVPAAGTADAPAFYAELLSSGTILGAVADSTVESSRTTGRQSVAEAIGIEERDPRRRRMLAIELLRSMIGNETSRETGMVRLTVTAADPALAAEIAGRLVAQVNDFNLRQRQTQAAAERRFVEARLSEARREMVAAESQLQSFLQRNRQYRNAPSLTFEFDRLQRELTNRQTLLTSLSQAFEQARIEEVRDIPRITVVDPPAVPIRPNSRRVVRKGLVGLVLGAAIGLLMALAKEYVRRRRRPVVAGDLRLGSY
jgi:uncharacterized protein involved in exopolysaccharide biosynthesis